MSNIASSLPPAPNPQVRSSSVESRVGNPRPGRLDITSITNQLFAQPSPTRCLTAPLPTRGIGSTLVAFRSAISAPPAPRTPVPSIVNDVKQVRFDDHASVGTVDGSLIAQSARMRLRLDTLSAVACLVEEGDALPAKEVTQQLLMCLALNGETAIVSERSEALMLKALAMAKQHPTDTCRPGDLPYDVLGSFLERVGQLQPHLLSGD